MGKLRALTQVNSRIDDANRQIDRFQAMFTSNPYAAFQQIGQRSVEAAVELNTWNQVRAAVLAEDPIDRVKELRANWTACLLRGDYNRSGLDGVPDAVERHTVAVLSRLVADPENDRLGYVEYLLGQDDE